MPEVSTKSPNNCPLVTGLYTAKGLYGPRKTPQVRSFAASPDLEGREIYAIAASEPNAISRIVRSEYANAHPPKKRRHGRSSAPPKLP